MGWKIADKFYIVYFPEEDAFEILRNSWVSITNNETVISNLRLINYSNYYCGHMHYIYDVWFQGVGTSIWPPKGVEINSKNLLKSPPDDTTGWVRFKCYIKASACK